MLGGKEIKWPHKTYSWDSKDLLYNTRNYVQYLIITSFGKNLKKVCVCVFITDSLYYTPETNITL